MKATDEGGLLHGSTQRSLYIPNIRQIAGYQFLVIFRKKNTNMKTNYRIVCFGLLLSLSFVSGCSEDDPAGSTPTPAVTGSMSAQVDGVNWTAASSKIKAYIYNNKINLEGIANDSTSITIQV